MNRILFSPPRPHCASRCIIASHLNTRPSPQTRLVNSPDSSCSSSASQILLHLQSISSCSHLHHRRFQANRHRAAARNCLRTWRNLGSFAAVTAASRTRHSRNRSKRRLAPSGSASLMPASESAPWRARGVQAAKCRLLYNKSALVIFLFALLKREQRERGPRTLWHAPAKA